jgi:serine/threonine-protein kinase
MTDGLLTPLELAVVLRDAAVVLEHAHRRGVIHGGIRPDRILATGHERGFPLCITDWSEARTYDTASLSGPAPGSSPYLAPEVLQRDAIDDRADVYALGVVAWEALTGALPGAASLASAPRDLALLLQQMVAHDRYDRPSSGEVASELAWAAQYVSHRADTFRDTAQAAAHAIETIDLEPDQVELVDTDGVPANANVPAVPMPRIRRPRWTPTGAITSDHVGEVAGEIGEPSPEDVS